jgi:hypothetical protein
MKKLILLILILLIILIVLNYFDKKNYIKCEKSGIQYKININRSKSDIEYSVNTLNLLKDISFFIDGDLNDKLYSSRIKDTKFIELYSNEYNTLGIATNKGESISIRLYNEDKTKKPLGQIYETLIHELAHLRTIKYGHEQEWIDKHEDLKRKYPINHERIQLIMFSYLNNG